ncbi:MAG: DUF3108 domain-containing protein, partial [Leptothrix sp. (in: b-proteobacteria)]
PPPAPPDTAAPPATAPATPAAPTWVATSGQPASAAEPTEPAPTATPTTAETSADKPAKPTTPPAEAAASASPIAETGATAAAEPAASTTSLALATPRPAARPLPGSSSAAPAPTRIPPSETLRYDVRRGLLSGEGQISWQVSGSQYRLTLEAHMPVFGTIFMQTSQGGFDAAGLAPTRHTEQRLRRSEQALSMVRGPGEGHVAFSTRTEQAPLSPGLQDRVSWMVQLPALLEGHPGALQAGQRFDIDVASVGGSVQVWHFDVVETRTADGLVKLVRHSDDPHATRAEAWADPRRHHWLVRVRLQESSGDPLELTEIRP